MQKKQKPPMVFRKCQNQLKVANLLTQRLLDNYGVKKNRQQKPSSSQKSVDINTIQEKSAEIDHIFEEGSETILRVKFLAQV